MQDHQAKMHALQKIMDAMTGLQHGGLKKKGAPAAMAVTVESKDPAMLAEDGHPKDGTADEESPDVLQQLLDHYSKKEPDDDDDFKVSTPQGMS